MVAERAAVPGPRGYIEHAASSMVHHTHFLRTPNQLRSHEYASSCTRTAALQQYKSHAANGRFQANQALAIAQDGKNTGGLVHPQDSTSTYRSSVHVFGTCGPQPASMHCDGLLYFVHQTITPSADRALPWCDHSIRAAATWVVLSSSTCRSA